MKNTKDHDSLLKAIYGYGSGLWSWWDQAFPNVFQIEFDNALLYLSPISPGGKPSNKLAMAFNYPTSISFLSNNNKPQNWPSLIREGKIDDFTLSGRYLTLNSDSEITQILKKCDNIDTVYGLDPRNKEFKESNFRFAFLSGEEDLGLIIGAKDLCLYSLQGEISINSVSDLYEKWWDYFYEYKAKKNLNQSIEPDWICDTIHIIKNEPTQ